MRHLAGTTRFALEGRQGLAGRAARRAWGLGVLAALLAPPASTPPAPAAVALDPALEPAADARWLARLQADTAAAPVSLTPTQHALLALRLRLLLAEAEALEALLAASPE